MTSDPEETNSVARPGRRFPAALQWGVAIALGVATALVFVALRGRIADSTPALTQETFDAAWQRWQAHGPESYEIETRVSGRQPATYRVVVVDTEAREAFRNGQPLQQKRTFETWSVPGMFSTIEADLTRLTKPAAGAAPARLMLRAEFDAELGYPRRYRRVEWGQTTEVTWSVEQFIATE